MAHNAFSYLESSGGIDAYRHNKNGLQVLFLPDHAAPVALFMITYHVGSRNEGPGTTGATHFLEHLMFKGTERFHKKQGTSIFNVLQSLGARINATTWMDRTNYYALLPKDQLARAIEIEADRMRNALIDPDDLASERTVILNELDRANNDPTRKLYDAVWTAAYAAHPYRHPTIGWRSDVEHMNGDQLRSFYDTFYWPNNATATVIGDVDLDDALTLVDQYFGSIPAAPHPIPEMYTREPEQLGERRTTVHTHGELGAVMQVYKMPSALEADTDALDVLGHLLSSGRSTRLYRALTDQGLTTSVYASALRLRNPALFVLLARLSQSATHMQVESILNAEIERVQNEGVTEAELQRARNKLKAQATFSRDGPFSTASQINEAIAAGDWKLYTTYLDRIGKVKVDDVQRVAQTYLVAQTRTTGYYLPI